MIEDSSVSAFKKRYDYVHPLVFHRSLEKADNDLELFEILETIPEMPFFWDDSSRRWIRCTDFLNISKTKNIIKSESK